MKRYYKPMSGGAVIEFTVARLFDAQIVNLCVVANQIEGAVKRGLALAGDVLLSPLQPM